MFFPKIVGILWLKKSPKNDFRRHACYFIVASLVFKLLLLLLQCFGNIFSKYEVSSLMISMFEILEYVVWSRSN